MMGLCGRLGSGLGLLGLGLHSGFLPRHCILDFLLSGLGVIPFVHVQL